MMTALQQTLPAVCEEVFKTSVLSSFERSCQEMFRQIDESFRRGTMECMLPASIVLARLIKVQKLIQFTLSYDYVQYLASIHMLYDPFVHVM